MHAIYLTTAMVCTVFSFLAWWSSNDYKLDGHESRTHIAAGVSGVTAALAVVYYILFIVEAVKWLAPTLFVGSTHGSMIF